MTNTNGTFRICKEVKVDYRSFICNLLCDGLHYFGGYGFYIDWNKNQYREAKERLANQNLDASFEDILTEMIIAGGALSFVDEEGDGEYTTDLTLSIVEKALWRFLEEEPSDAFIMGVERIIEEEYDADDCDVILQYILFGEYMFS
jgi:hypothetical protein